MFDCCWFRGNQPQPGVRASPLLPTLLFPSPLLRAGLSPPSAEPPENGQRGSQHSPGMEDTAKSAKRRGRRRGGRSDRGPPPTKSIHMPCADQGNTAPPSPTPFLRTPFSPEPVKLSSPSEVVLYLGMAAEVRFGAGRGDFSLPPLPHGD